MSHNTSTLTSLVIGGAGFIGQSVVRRLVANGRRVVVVDNFCRGRREHLAEFIGASGFQIIDGDVSDRRTCGDVFGQVVSGGAIQDVWHLAANSDIPAGVADPDIDHKDTFLTTFEVLRAMRAHGVGTLHFASSSAVYGDHGELRIAETLGPLVPISNYGAMKLASEAQICAAAESFLRRVNIFRFPNVVGVPATHGVIVDFIRKLKIDSATLHVLGDGSQKKAYLHVSDLVDAMFIVRNREGGPKVEIINIGPADDGVTVAAIAESVVGRVSPSARIVYGKGNKGWVGDVPRFRYSIDRVQTYGWVPAMGSFQAISRAVNEIAAQEHV